MHKLSTSIAIISIVIIAISLPSAFSINLFPAYSQWLTSNGLAAPGQTSLPIKISITNLYSSISFVNLTFINTYPFKIFNVSSNNYTFFIPRWIQGQTLNFTLLLNIANNLKTGIYAMNFSVYSGSFKYSSYVAIPVEGYVEFSLQSVWGELNNTLMASPGQNNLPFTIIIKNEGNVLANNVTIILNNSQTYPILFYENELKVGYVPPGSFNIATDIANISNGIRDGLYYLPVEVKYFNNSIVNEYLPVYILGHVNFDLQSIWGSLNQQFAASPGMQDVPLTILIKNIGNVLVSNVSLFIPNQFPLILFSNKIEIGYIPQGQLNYAIVYVSINSDAKPGLYYLNVTIHYFKNQTINSQLPVLIYSPNINIQAFTFPPQLFPGYTDARLNVIMSDLSNAIVNSANLTVNLPFQLISSNQINIGTIPSFKPINVTFLFNIPNNVTPGSYSLNLTLKYDGGQYNYIYNVQVYPKANFEVVHLSYNPLTPGSSSNIVTIALKNIGLAEAKNVKIILQPNQVIYPHVSSSNPLMALTISSIFIGDLYPNQVYNISLVLDVSDGALPGYYNLELTVLWNQTGSIYPFIQNINVSLKVSPTFEQQLLSPSITNIYFDILLLIVIAIIIVAVLAIVKRRKK